MVGRSMVNDSLVRGALVLLVVGGLLLGSTSASRAATPLGSKRGASVNAGVSAQPEAETESDGTTGADEGAVIALGRKPGVSPGSGTIHLVSNQPGMNEAGQSTSRIAQGSILGTLVSTHIGEEIPQRR